MTYRQEPMKHVPGEIALWTSAVVLTILASGLTVEAQTLSVDYRGAVRLGATATDQNGEDFTVTGLSGLTWMHDTQFAAVMDNSDKLIFFKVEFAADGAIRSATISGGLTLADSCDFEGIAFSTPERDSVFLAEEDTPAIQEYSLSDGALLRALKPPPLFFNDRPNFAFESLSRQPGGTELWTANEEALTIDGDFSTPQHGTLVRLLRYAPPDEADGGAGCTRGAGPAEQFAYITEPMHGGDIYGGRSGLVDLAVLPNGKLLALERSFAMSIPDFFQNRLYELDFAGATEVSEFADGLEGEVFTPVSKNLLWSGNVGNLEGLAVGPPLVGGNRALLGIVDDGDPLSTTQLVAFELHCPGNVDGDCVVGASDLALLLGNWGPCPEPCTRGDAAETCRADFDGDCIVGAFDLSLLLSNCHLCSRQDDGDEGMASLMTDAVRPLRDARPAGQTQATVLIASGGTGSTGEGQRLRTEYRLVWIWPAFVARIVGLEIKMGTSCGKSPLKGRLSSARMHSGGLHRD